jgi:M protein trans-acting positive regulator (MGA) HTH domain/Mga helix-turn-helix domain/PRD domain
MDKANLRRLKLIDILISKEEWFKSEELAKILNCTEKTIRTDIPIINATFPKGWHINSIKGKGVYLDTPSHSSLDQVRSLFYKDSLSYQVIMFILIKEITTISDLGKALFTHHNTVYKILERVDLLLKFYDLTLNRAPLQIEGRELQIRLLCCDILSGLYSHTNKWVFEAYSYSCIKKIIMKTSEKYNLFFYPTTITKSIYYVGIMLLRLNKKHQLDLNYSYNMKESIFFSIASEICTQLEKKYKITIPTNEILGLALVISALPFICNNALQNDEIIMHYHDQSERFYQELHLFVSMLEKKLGLKLHDHNEFIICLQKQFKALSFILCIPNRITSSCWMVDYVLGHYPELYNKIEVVLRNWCNHFSYPEVNSEAVAKITLNIQAQLVNLNLVTKRVLLLSREGYGVQRYIRSRLKQEFRDKIKFIELKNGGITSDHLNELCLDFIIADFQLEIDLIPVATINPTLSERDINHIAQLLK